ncbi:MAG TPA: wax ester/triacylglycerol synthase domain-containing protein, partial [Blastococcus sp.]|nr:wax ester/triacylglycerol synthase domain-containing protein [Blastococcus sp.]
MPLTRLRMDELVNAWVADRCTPFQIALLGVFDATPFLGTDGTLDVPRIRVELAARAHRVEALGRRVVWTRPGEGRPVWAADPAFDPARHV